MRNDYQEEQYKSVCEFDVLVAGESDALTLARVRRQTAQFG